MRFEQELGRALIRADQRDFYVLQTLCKQRAELLEALKGIIASVDNGQCVMLDKAREAITKAESAE